MKTAPDWHYKPYIPYDKRENAKTLHICSLKPDETSVSGEVLGACEGTVLLRAYKRGGWRSEQYSGGRFAISGLKKDTDYELFIKSENGESARRRARTSCVPGTVVNYLHPKDDIYSFSGSCLCSPSIVLLSSGKIITSMDVYEHHAPQNLTILMKSDDGGESFSYLCELFPLFWGKLFWHRNALYIFGTSTEYGDLLIGRSLDEGETWSQPTVIARGSSDPDEKGFHRAPTIFLNENGLLLTAVEYGCHGKNEFKSALLFAKEDADLLDTDSWTLSPFLSLDESVRKLNPKRNRPIEGNLVIAPDGTLINFLRFDMNMAVLYKADINRPEMGFEFYRTLGFPLAHTKFEIQTKDGVYYAVGNRPPKRNILSLYTSSDLLNWTLCKDVLDYSEFDMNKVAFQYPAFVFDKDGILVLSRTAFGGARNFHDSNYQTLHKVQKVNPTNSFAIP